MAKQLLKLKCIEMHFQCRVFFFLGAALIRVHLMTSMCDLSYCMPTSYRALNEFCLRLLSEDKSCDPDFSGFVFWSCKEMANILKEISKSYSITSMKHGLHNPVGFKEYRLTHGHIDFTTN